MKAASGMRWEVGIAAKEWGVHRQTLSARLKRENLLPGKDGCFSTAQIDEAINGDLEGERLRELRERADKLALENAQTRRDLISLAELAPVINRAIVAIKAEIGAITYIEQDDKDKILARCGELWSESFGASRPNAIDLESPAPV